MNAINIIAYTDDAAQIAAVKAFLKALKIKFELSKEKDEDGYNPEFVAKIKKSQQEHEEGNFITVEREDLKSFLGLQ
jgi:hypothetical protein